MTALSEHPPPTRDMVFIAGGTFTMGSDHHYPEEAPAHQVSVDGFWIDAHPVTNNEFKAFVTSTGYVTVAEQDPDPAQYPGAPRQLLRAASVVFQSPPHAVSLNDHLQWWKLIPGASWRHPRGPGSSVRGLADHPVVHIAWADAQAYAAWAGKAIPTEAEWEYAARGGLEAQEFAWGNEFTPDGQHMANTWQGDFPLANSCADGYQWTSPVGSFPPNGYGLHDMIGNVWEWTTDWYTTHRRQAPATPSCCATPPIRLNPTGGTEQHSFDRAQPEVRIPRKVIKGGSHLCAPNYCRRYRPAARMAHPADTGTSHLGLRCVVRSGGETVVRSGGEDN